MTKGGSKHMIITVDTQTGKVVEPVVDEKGRKATRVDPKKIGEIYRSEEGFKYVGTILHAHSSPGCAYLELGGTWYVICF